MQKKQIKKFIVAPIMIIVGVLMILSYPLAFLLHQPFTVTIVVVLGLGVFFIIIGIHFISGEKAKMRSINRWALKHHQQMQRKMQKPGRQPISGGQPISENQQQSIFDKAADKTAETLKLCPVCGVKSKGQFCSNCGAAFN